MQADVWLVRHGQSQANAGQVTQHPKSIALTELGWEQAKRVAKRLDVAAQRVIVSPYARTLDTAGPYLDKLGQQGLDASVLEWPIEEFTYLNPPRLGAGVLAAR
jgi:broad specificity phosphatase PhoE